MERLIYPRSEIKVFNGVCVQIDRFTCGELDTENKKILAQELRPLTGKGFLRNNLEDPKFIMDVNEHIIGAERLIIVRKLMDKSPVSFIASGKLEALNLNFYYLGGIIVDPEFHKSGLGKYLLVSDLLEAKKDTIFLCTQSKKMRGLLGHVASIDYDLSIKMAEFKFQNSFHKRVGNVIKGLYVDSFIGGKSLYEDVNTFAKDAIDDISGMVWKDGDSAVLAGYLKSENKLKEELEKISPIFREGFGN